MAGIQEYLNQIKNAIYGKDVRQAIHDGIETCYKDGKAGAVDLEARQRISNLAQLHDGSTTGDAELIDARTIGTKTYPTLHDAIDTEVVALKDVADMYGAINYLKNLNTVGETADGITWNYSNGVYSYSGTATNSVTVYRLILENPSDVFKAGATFHVKFDSTDENVYLQIYRYAGSSLTLFKNLTNDVDEWFTLPAGTTGILIRARVTNGATVDGTFTFSVEGAFTPSDSKKIEDEVAKIKDKLGYVKVLNSNDSIDALTDTGAFIWLGGNHPLDAPSGNDTSIMVVIHTFDIDGFVLQTVHTTGGKMYQRLMGSASTGWYQWHEVSAGSGGGGGGTVIENTYNITTSPHITTDTNGWIQAVDTDTTDETGKTDMTGAIMSMLTDTGYCHLGEGVFYVSGNIDMPAGSTLCGCGKKTVIRLLQSVDTGYCVKMKEFCTIKDISFEGAKSLTLPSSKGTRVGVSFSANYDATPSVPSSHCMMDNVWITNFSGSGILCHNTSINYAKGLYATNVYIHNCYVGLDIDYYSEFNKFVNVCIAWCKFACINNGGNNVFVSCTFHATDTGFYVDGSQPNSAHGSMTGCTFCHIGSNRGKAISMAFVSAGFVIDSCQFWYNSIELSSCKGVIISNCELGKGINGGGATIRISGGATIMFDGCMFMGDEANSPDIVITNNDKVKFVNCYGSDTGELITA